MDFGSSVSIPQIVAEVNAQIFSQSNSRNIFTVDDTTISSKTFDLSASPVLGSESVVWNGLIQDPSNYQIQASSLIFNPDISLANGDNILVTFIPQG